ncbi:Sucrose-6-phosphate hydrolase [compost metagenome]
MDEQGIRLERKSLQHDEMLTRYWDGKVTSLRVLCDSSSVEIFINEGECVMSSRYFPGNPAQVRFEGASAITLRYWSLRASMIE